MPPRRIVAILLGCGLLLAAVLVLATVVGDGPDRRLAVQGRTETAPTTIPVAPESSAPTDAPATTVPLVPLTTGVPVPHAVEAPPPTAPPTATPGAPRATTSPTSAGAPATGTGVDGSGAVLARPSEAQPRAVDKAKGCDSANDPGWTVEKCGALRSGGGVLLWVVETKGKGRRTLVLKEQTSGKWAVVLAARDDTGAAFSSVGVRGADVSGDGEPELVFGFHRRGSEGRLSVDVVDASAAVPVHRELVKGSVRAADGRLETWSANGEAFDHVVIRFSGGAWQASPPKRVVGGDVPPSMV